MLRLKRPSKCSQGELLFGSVVATHIVRFSQLFLVDDVCGSISTLVLEYHHLRNVITRSAGYQEQEGVDSFILALEVDDLILICSAGLHGWVLAEKITIYCKKYGVLAVDQLISEANNNGGGNNISVVICQIKV